MKDINDEQTLDWLGDQNDCLGLEHEYLSPIEQTKPKDIEIDLTEVVEVQLELF